MDQNIVILEGIVGSEPSFRESGKTAVCTFVVGTETDGDPIIWHKVVAWERLAELCKAVIVKGNRVLVSGRLRPRQVTTKTGRRREMEIQALQIDFVV